MSVAGRDHLAGFFVTGPIVDGESGKDFVRRTEDSQATSPTQS
jgi:hypothetical protein